MPTAKRTIQLSALAEDLEAIVPTAPPPGLETPAPADFEVLQHRLLDIGSKVDEVCSFWWFDCFVESMEACNVFAFLV